MSLRRALAGAAVVVAVVAASLAAQAPGVTGRVVAIADGDTITVLDASKRQHRIRLNGIDAPETGQPISTVAKTNLSELVFGREVTVIGSKVDRYGRLVGTVIVGAGNADLEQLRAGLAWYYRDYAEDVAPENRPLYEAAEAEARTLAGRITSGSVGLAGRRARAGRRVPRAAQHDSSRAGRSSHREPELKHLPRAGLPVLQRRRRAQSRLLRH